MKINSTNATNFKSYIPVQIYARNEGEKNYRRVYYDENDNYLTRCQGRVVRNLNHTIKNPNTDFVNFYKSKDKQYAEYQAVRTVYDKMHSGILMVTGLDVSVVDQMAHPIGRAKKEARTKADDAADDMIRTGEHPELIGIKVPVPKTPEVKQTAENYFKETYKYINNSCRRLKNENGDPLVLKVFFEAKRNKKGEVKDFTLTNAGFVREA